MSQEIIDVFVVTKNDVQHDRVLAVLNDSISSTKKFVEPILFAKKSATSLGWIKIDKSVIEGWALEISGEINLSETTPTYQSGDALNLVLGIRLVNAFKSAVVISNGITSQGNFLLITDELKLVECEQFDENGVLAFTPLEELPPARKINL